MVEGILDVVDFATLTNGELARLGVPDERITFERIRRSGHTRSISPAYAKSIGWWGGVRSMRDISDALELPMARVHGWAMFRRLRTRTRTFARTQAQLAVLTLGTPGSAVDVAPKLGLLPIEVCLHRAAAEVMRSELSVTFGQILSWSPDQLEAEWRALELVVGHTPGDAVDYDDPAELEALVHEAKSGWSRDELGALVDLVKRELPDVDREPHEDPCTAP
jgi:hypothetical protein